MYFLKQCCDGRSVDLPLGVNQAIARAKVGRLSYHLPLQHWTVYLYGYSLSNCDLHFCIFAGEKICFIDDSSNCVIEGLER